MQSNLIQVSLHRKNTIKQDSSSEVIKIDLNEWKFMIKGTDHFIFNNINSESPHYKMLIMFERHKIQQENIHQILESIYKVELRKHFLYKYVLKKKQLIINKDDQLRFQKFLNENGCKGANTERLWTTQNLFYKQKWDVFVEFKVKSPLPSVYNSTTLRQIAKKFGVNIQELESILKDCPSVEKTKWYRKKVDEESFTGHQNPFCMFNLLEDKTVPDYCHTKLFKNFPQGKDIPFNQLNQKIHDFLIGSKVLQEVYKLQSLYVGPVPQNTEKLLKQEEHFKNIQFNMTNPERENKRFLGYIDVELQKLPTRLQKQTCVYQNQQKQQSPQKLFDEVLRFLISLTWRDISIYYRANLQTKQEDLTIIDYALKPYRKISQNQLKQDKFLHSFIGDKLEKSKKAN